MGIFDRAIKRGVNRALGNTVENALGNAIENAVAPKLNAAVGKAAQSVNSANDGANGTADGQYAASGASQAEITQAANTLGGLFGGFSGAASGFAVEAAKNMKLCPSCGEGAPKDVKFCPSCGAKLPDITIADGAVCPSCGKQNEIGTKFCADCGTKLPSAVAEEQAALAENDAVMARWDETLSDFPKWSCGGAKFRIESFDCAVMFSADFQSSAAAQNAVRQYRALLLQNGFRQAGEHPDPCHLYKRVNGICRHCDTEHCFEGGSETSAFYFNSEEPTGGFDYVKPEPKKTATLRDLFNL